MKRNDDFSVFFKRHYPQVLAYGRRRMPEERARDLAAETMTIAWRRWEHAEPGGLPWLYKTARLLAKNTARTEAHQALSHDDGSLDQEQPSFVDNLLDDLDLRLAWTTLSSPDREVLLLTAWEGLSLTELAETLGCSYSAAGVRLHRARCRLQQALDAPTVSDAPVMTQPNEGTRS